MGGRDDQDMYLFWQRRSLSADMPSRNSESSPRAQSTIRRERLPQVSEKHHSARNIKDRIRLLVLHYDMSYADICATLKQDGYSVSGVTVSAVRSDMRETLRFLQRADISLFDAEQLERFRRKRPR